MVYARRNLKPVYSSEKLSSAKQFIRYRAYEKLPDKPYTIIGLKNLDASVFITSTDKDNRNSKKLSATEIEEIKRWILFSQCYKSAYNKTFNGRYILI